MPSWRLALAITLLIVVLPTRRGEASPIPWSYQWSAQPIVVNADPPGPHDQPAGGIALTPGAITITGGQPGVALGDSSIVAVNLTAFNFTPGTYQFTNSPYHLGVTLTDVNSHQSGTLQFAGAFDGNFTYWKMKVSMHFTSASQQSLVLGKNFYTVKLTHFDAPQPPGDGGAGSIQAFVSVQPVPEPASLILAAIGLAAVLLSWFRRNTYPKFAFHR